LNKKQLILSEAKRLFGHYGYLGFTLKQLASACEVTSPALYYFYSSKADLFKDCLLSEISARRTVTLHCIEQSTNLSEFTLLLINDAIDICALSSFRAGQAMQEIIYLPEAMQQELRQAWRQQVINPVEDFLRRILPELSPSLSYSLLSLYLVDMATYAAQHVDEYSRGELANLFIALVSGVPMGSDR
jgi:AcrR family transcriptional regulator